MTVPVIHASSSAWLPKLAINAKLVADWLVQFLISECKVRRNIHRAVIGLSGGVDSAVVAYLAARAFGPDQTFVFRLPYKISSKESLEHADLVVAALGLQPETIEISAMVDGYASIQKGISALRIGNICARCRMTVLFDQSARLGALPIGTGNKTERLLGYFTWHGDDAPPINPLGDLYKTQVLDLARYLGVPAEIVNKPPTADLIKGQTDEGDFGITYDRIDPILNCILLGWSDEMIIRAGFTLNEVEIVRRRLDTTHWKRRLPTVAMMSNTAIGEYYLRPVDY